MGIGFGVTAKALTKDGKPLPRASAFAAIRKAVEESCENPFLASLIEFGEHEHDLFVMLHPSAEAIFFTWDPAGKISADAKTSTTGPGYHAYAVDVVRTVGQRCGFAWEWEDETDYAETGNFGSLQDQMSEFLRALAASFLDEERVKDGVSLAVNMPIGAPVPVRGGPFTITPLGPRSRSFWESLARGENLEKTAREFYPWWNRERDADFYQKTGLGLLWMEMLWRPPASESEEAKMRLTLDCFERASELDPALQLPQAEIQELHHLLDLEEDDPIPTPAPNLIGYYRAEIRRHLPGEWTIELPGYWQEHFDEESGDLSLWHNDRSVHASTYDIEPKPGRPMPTPDALAEIDEKMIPAGAERVEFRLGGLVGRAFIHLHEEDGEKTMLLQGTVGASEAAADVTITYADAADRDWAVKTFKSISLNSHTKPAQDLPSAVASLKR